MHLISLSFSPNGGCESSIVDAVNKAKLQVRMLAYAFTSKAIADALTAAVKRGVDVQGVVDSGASSEKTTLDGDLAAAFPLRIDRRHKIAHNKTMVIDLKVIVTGSFNFTTNAEHQNAENSLIFEDAEIAAKYFLDWQLHWDHSIPWQSHKKILGSAALVGDF